MTRSFHPMKMTLAAVVVAIAGTLAMSAQAQPMGGMHRGPGGFGPGAHGPMMGGGDGPRGGMQLSERMLDRVKATPEQRAQIRQIMDGARKDLLAQRDARRAQRDQMMQLFTQPNVDAQAVETLRKTMMAQHDQASQRMTLAMVDASRVLTPEQRKALADGIKQRRDLMERHLHERRSLDAPKS